MKHSTKEDLLHIAKTYLDGGYDGSKWQYIQPSEDMFMGSIALSVKYAKNVKFFLHVRDKSIACYHQVEMNVPEGMRDKVCELITRANYFTIRGNFELDYRDGELRFKLVMFDRSLLKSADEALKNMDFLMFAGMGAWKTFGDDLVKLMMGFESDRSIKELVDDALED